MKKETKGILSIIFGVYGIFSAPPISLFFPISLPLSDLTIIFLIFGMFFGKEKNKIKTQKIGFIVSTIGIILIIGGILWNLFFI